MRTRPEIPDTNDFRDQTPTRKAGRRGAYDLCPSHWDEVDQKKPPNGGGEV
jgi:hypothetical protein